MINIITALRTVGTITKTISEVKKEIKKTKNAIKNDMQPLEKYVNEPNQNNIDIAKIKEDIILLKNMVKQFDSKANRKRDKKWYDE